MSCGVSRLVARVLDAKKGLRSTGLSKVFASVSWHMHSPGVHGFRV